MTHSRQSDSGYNRFLAKVTRSADVDHKWMAMGIYCMLVGLVFANSEWSVHSLGLPLMAIGLILPLAPFIIRRCIDIQAQETQGVIAISDAKPKQSRHGLVYEIRSRNYSAAS